MKNDIHINLAKLEQKVESMSEKLNKLDEIGKYLKEISQQINGHHTDVELLKRDMDDLVERNRDLDMRIKFNEKKINSLAIKLGGIMAIINFAGFIIMNFFLK